MPRLYNGFGVLGVGFGDSVERLENMRRLAIGVVACIFSGILLAEGLFSWPMVNDCRPYGELTYIGAPAQVGLRLQAKILGTVVVETTVTAAGWYALSIPPDDPHTTARDGWNPDDEITIWINDRKAQPTFAAFEGSKRINLDVPSIALDVKKSTWGKIKALFR